MQESQETMGERIKRLRHNKQMTLEEVAIKVGVGKSTVRKWETGMIENMKRDKIQSLANALGTTPAYLMGWKETEQPSVPVPSEEEKEIRELLGKLSTEKKKQLIQYALFLLQQGD